MSHTDSDFCSQYVAKISSFPTDYGKDFNSFWRWKIKEEKERHLLDFSLLDTTFSMLRDTLGGWQVYRGRSLPKDLEPWRNLHYALGRISRAYENIRNCSLLEFDRVPIDALETIWNELGKVKEGGVSEDGKYFVVSVCKPLMLLWGQTLPFDSNNRKRIPPEHGVPRQSRWDFRAWRQVMISFNRRMLEHPEIIDCFQAVAKRNYGVDHPVPYGRLWDMFYF